MKSTIKKEAEFLPPPFSLMMQHVEYVIKLVGVDYVGIGSDYDGILPKHTLLQGIFPTYIYEYFPIQGYSIIVFCSK